LSLHSQAGLKESFKAAISPEVRTRLIGLFSKGFTESLKNRNNETGILQGTL